jgi:Amt family ammonium transporter
MPLVMAQAPATLLLPRLRRRPKPSPLKHLRPRRQLLPRTLLPAAAAAAAAPAAAAPAPVPNKGDTAWMMVSTLLVILMTVPGLALFYGGLVRSKNMLSVLMQVMVTFSMIVVLWFIYGYSLAFTEGNAVHRRL